MPSVTATQAAQSGKTLSASAMSFLTSSTTPPHGSPKDLRPASPACSLSCISLFLTPCCIHHTEAHPSLESSLQSAGPWSRQGCSAGLDSSAASAWAQGVGERQATTLAIAQTEILFLLPSTDESTSERTPASPSECSKSWTPSAWRVSGLMHPRLAALICLRRRQAEPCAAVLTPQRCAGGPG